MNQITLLLESAARGEPQASNELLPVVYGELRKLATQWLTREKVGQTLQPTALVHEAYLRLVGNGTERHWDSRGHFFAAAAQAMRRILVENARKRKTIKRGADRHQVELSERLTTVAPIVVDLIDLDEALTNLAKRDERKARLVELRFFGGMTIAEAAVALEISEVTAVRDWVYARAWLHREMSSDKIIEET